MKEILRKLASITATLMVGCSVFLPAALVSAQTSTPTKNAVCEGVGLTGGSAGCGTKAESEAGVSNVVKAAINVFSVVVGVIAVIMVIIGGLKYITSSGDSNSISSAKNTVLYAVIGLVIVAMAQVIVRFVLNRV